LSPQRILLADDHALVRAGIRSLLEAIEGVEVLGEAGDGPEALRLAEELKPDVVLLDIALPGLSGLEVAARLTRAGHKGVVLLSMHSSEEHVRQALSIGVAGYVLKDASTTDLEAALRTVAQGQVYLSPAVSKRVVEVMSQGPGEAEASLQSLTPRQREILQLIAEGGSTKEIAFRLGLSVKTVETHRAEIMRRLDIRDVASLVRYAIRKGLLNP
jgi:DNA-binding NarL/FixJ family response regulator